MLLFFTYFSNTQQLFFFYYQDIVNYKKRHGNDTILSLKFIPKIILYTYQKLKYILTKYTKYIKYKTIWARGNSLYIPIFSSFFLVLIYNILVILKYIFRKYLVPQAFGIFTRVQLITPTIYETLH